jgi:hypothetical protein
MNQLPKVLQNEIWEYVRGDRAYWKQQFTNVLNFGGSSKAVDACGIPGGVVTMLYMPEIRQWWVRIVDPEEFPIAVSPFKWSEHEADRTLSRISDLHNF